MTIFRCNLAVSLLLLSACEAQEHAQVPKAILSPENAKRMSAGEALALFKQKPNTFRDEFQTVHVQGVAYSVPDYTERRPNRPYVLFLTDDDVHISLELPYATAKDAVKLEANPQLTATCFGADVFLASTESEADQIDLKDCMIETSAKDTNK